MLSDPFLDELIDAFEAGFANAGNLAKTVDACPFEIHDSVRRTAWYDGATFNTLASPRQTYHPQFTARSKISQKPASAAVVIH